MTTAIVIDSNGRVKVGPSDDVIGIPGPPGVDNLVVSPTAPLNPIAVGFTGATVWLDTSS